MSQVTDRCSRFSDKQLIIGTPLIKGAIFGPSTLLIVEAAISPFIKALLLTIISALITGLAMVISAFVSTRRVEERVAKGQEEIKSAIGGRRTEDKPDEPSP